jgi:hypothetical protein
MCLLQQLNWHVLTLIKPRQPWWLNSLQVLGQDKVRMSFTFLELVAGAHRF